MKKVFLFSLVVVSMAQSVFAATASDSTKIIESISSTSYSKVECSMEDYTCQKLVLEMGRQEALGRVISGDSGKLSLVLQQSIAIQRKNDESSKNLTDDQIIEILASQAQ